MERWAGRVALVTGASSGIGAAVVELFAKRGMKVIGCARRVERIQVSTCIPKFAKVLVQKNLFCVYNSLICYINCLCAALVGTGGKTAGRAWHCGGRIM